MRHGTKQVKFIDRAKVPFYIIKDKESKEAQVSPMFIEKDKVEKITVWSDMLFREIALRTDAMAYYDRVSLNFNQRSNMKNLFKSNLIYDADMDVSDRYIKEFYDEFQPDKNYKLHKCYADIEVDLMPEGFKKDAAGHIGYMGFPEEDIAPCPVNIITLVDGKSLIVYTFVCKNSLNTQQKQFIAEYGKEKSEEIKKLIFERNNILVNDVDISFYNSEEETIEAFFNKVHVIDPDTISGWNFGFDVKTLMNRLTHLYGLKASGAGKWHQGYDTMLETVCDKKYSYIKNKNGEDIYITPFAFYKQNSNQSYVDRMDEFNVLDGTIWIDNMLLYANVRKTQGIKESYSLDAVSNDELGSEKLDYHGCTIKNLAWKNFDNFVKYNIFDVILLKALEDKNLDIDMLQKLSEVTNTRKYKVFKKTISLKNFVSKFALEQGFVMSNNKNAQYGDDGDYYTAQFLNKKEVVENNNDYRAAFEKRDNFGAYVGDPNLNDACGVDDTTGHPSKFVYENVFDEDFSSLYPSIIRAYNLDKNTQVGKFFLLNDDIKRKLVNEFGYGDLFVTSKNDEADGSGNTNDIGPTLVDSLTSQNWSRIGEKYFDLPSTTEMIKDLKSKKEKD